MTGAARIDVAGIDPKAEPVAGALAGFEDRADQVEVP
jgi:hypothetical protein